MARQRSPFGGFRTRLASVQASCRGLSGRCTRCVPAGQLLRLRSACLTGTSAYADSHGRPMVATPHAQAPKPTAKPTTPGGSRSTAVPTHRMKSGPASSTAVISPTRPPHHLARQSGWIPIAAKIASKPQPTPESPRCCQRRHDAEPGIQGFKNQVSSSQRCTSSQNSGATASGRSKPT